MPPSDLGQTVSGERSTLRDLEPQFRVNFLKNTTILLISVTSSGQFITNFCDVATPSGRRSWSNFVAAWSFDGSLSAVRDHRGDRSRGLQWAIVRPEDLLPHRPPFLFVDEILDLVPGESARGRWRLTGDEWFFTGHFPGRPTLPGVLMCEAIAQVGALAVLADPRFAGKLPLFGGLDSARFRRQVIPGDELILECEMGRLSSRAGKGTGRALVDGALATQASLFFVIPPDSHAGGVADRAR
jgi:3-hydroxyacyl-[acyl-carrier-protein] dehydratase